MPLRRIPDLPDRDRHKAWKLRRCLDPEHRPPMHMVYEPGDYEYTCPSCGHKTVFTVPGVYWRANLRST